MQVGRRAVLCGVLALTGATALALQVTWQRVVSLHVGTAVASNATVVAGFLAGLGIGSIVGGRLADRRGPRSALRTLACAELGVACFALVSTRLLHDVFTSSTGLLGTRLGVALTFAILLVPTTLMGLSLPLAARALTAHASEAPLVVGRLYACNTAGAALGALTAGWYLVGGLGYVRTTWLCGAAGLFAALVVYVLRTSTDPDGPAPAKEVAAPPEAAERRRVAGWYVAYGLSGALALGLQQAYFRLASAIGRSNSYSFATVLALYLAAFATGTAVGARLATRTTDPRRAFLWSQFGAGFGVLAGLVVVTSTLPALGLDGRFESWFGTDGFANGYNQASWQEIALFGVLLPAALIVPPVMLMGASFAFAERAVVDRMSELGRRTGGLIAANTFGNVVGALVSAFWLFDLLGTAGTTTALAAILMLGSGLAAATAGRTQLRRLAPAAGVILVSGALVVAAPSNDALWRFLSGHGADDVAFVSEDAACASVIGSNDERSFRLTIDGARQNDYPFDDFHVLIGLVPTLLSDDPGHALAVGFGIGSTSHALLADRDRDRVTTVELCGGNYEAADELAALGFDEFVGHRDDSRHRRLVGDGRNHLLRTRGRYDVVVVDTLRITSAFSGQHHSRQFYERVAEALGDDGVFAQWVPTWRAQNSAAQVFPHLLTLRVEAYGSEFMIGSHSPIAVTADELVDRFRDRAASRIEPGQRARVEEFLRAWDPKCVTDGRVVEDLPAAWVNDDMAPRDEYHRNNGFISESETRGTCSTPAGPDD